MPNEEPPASRSEAHGGAALVASGILVSRVLGFVRDAVLAYHFGAGPHADVFRTALRGPNVVQNLLGEQTLSASFIPIYSRLQAAGRSEAAGRFAGAAFGLLLAAGGLLALVGVLAARPLVALFAPGYLGDAAAVAAGHAQVDRYALTVGAVRLIFPMTGILVLASWCLGVLNSHRRFFLPYAAPALWNAAIIAVLAIAARGAVPSSWLGLTMPLSTPRDALLAAACWGALLGGLLQFSIQLPAALRAQPGFRPSLSLRAEGVREALRAFGPLAASRGAVQISGYFDLLLASLLAAGAVGALGYAQTLYLLPVSLFGLSVAAAELPELARRGGEPEEAVRRRVRSGLIQTAFLTVPAAVGYLTFGLLLVSALFRRGSFGSADAWLVAATLAAYTVGLPATNASRLLGTVFLSRLEPRVPAVIAIGRVTLSLALGVPLMLLLDRFAAPGDGALRLGAVGLATAAAAGAWFELALLRWRLRQRLPGFRLPLAPVGRMVAIAALAAAAAGVVWSVLPLWPAPPKAAIVVGLYAGLYLLVCVGAKVPGSEPWLRRLHDRGRRRRS